MELLEEPMQKKSSDSSTWRALSTESAGAVEKAGSSIVAIHARRRIPASGVHWRSGIVVTAEHALERDEEITVRLPDRQTVVGMLAGRDPSTDIAILKIETVDLPMPEIADITTFKVGHWVLAAGRTSEGGLRASLAMVGVVLPALRTWRGGLLDQTVRLDRNIHPNLSGGPSVDDQGRLLGINTSALSRYTAVVIPASTVERVASELEKKGHVRRGYLGVGMQLVRLPNRFHDLLKIQSETGIMIMRVEPESPAEKAGVTLGDVLVGLNETPMHDIDDVQTYLAGEHIGKPLKASIIRGGALTEVVIGVGERPGAS